MRPKNSPFRSPPGTISLASDNNAGVHPAVLRAVAAANRGHFIAYGDDPYTERARKLLRRAFQAAEAFPVFNGTGANVVALRAACRPFEAVLCAEGAHLNMDECGAPEALAGVKLLPCPAPGGKLTPAVLEARLSGRGDEHRVQPRLVSITQATELGTVYTPRELRALSAFCRRRGLLLHIDGARLANAAAFLGTSLDEASAGADLVSFGLTKNGALAAEAVIVRRPALARELPYLRKQSLQLSSKMRFFSAQLNAMLSDGLWRRNARRANAMARLLADGARCMGVEIVQPVEANAVFVRLSPPVLSRLQKRRFFYAWDERAGIARWMCAWDMTPAAVEDFLADLRRALRPAT